MFARSFVVLAGQQCCDLRNARVLSDEAQSGKGRRLGHARVKRRRKRTCVKQNALKMKQSRHERGIVPTQSEPIYRIDMKGFGT
jgi:hypothetical protein